MKLFATLAMLQGGDQSQAADEVPDLAGMLMHHLVDTKELEFQIFGYGRIIHLDEYFTFAPLHVGPLTVDFSITKHFVFVTLAALLLLAVFLPIGRAMTNKYTNSAPKGFANAMEAMVLYFRDEVVRRNIGHGADAYTPFILTLFFFILGMNLLGLVPFGSTATGNLSVTMALALVTFFVTEISGMRELGFKGYMGTIFYAPAGLSGGMRIAILAIMTPVEFLGKLTKPFALMIRLFANMVAGHTLVLSLLGLIFMFATLTIGKWFIAGASLTMVIAIMCLELFVAFLQAYIFAMLSAVFIGLIRHPH